MKIKNILLGAHISVAGGFDKAIDRAEEIGINCMQIFTKSNRQWHAKEITKEEANSFKERQNASQVVSVMAHAAYLINMGSKSDETVQKSIESLSQELQRCEQLSIPYLVLHPGTARFENEEKSLQFTAEQIDFAIKKSGTKNVELLLETMAGQGNTIGYNFQQLGSIIRNSQQADRIGVCFDTCHAFVSGYDFHSQPLYDAMWKEFDEEIGIHKLKAFHMNDSKKELGSKVDRHEEIGEGTIPISSFAFILKDKRFQGIPKIIETPEGTDKAANDRKNVEALRDLAE